MKSFRDWHMRTPAMFCLVLFCLWIVASSTGDHEVCDRIHDNREKIRAIGVTRGELTIVTTDGHIFKLPTSLIVHVGGKEYQVVINRKPSTVPNIDFRENSKTMFFVDDSHTIGCMYKARTRGPNKECVIWYDYEGKLKSETTGKSCEQQWQWPNVSSYLTVSPYCIGQEKCSVTNILEPLNNNQVPLSAFYLQHETLIVIYTDGRVEFRILKELPAVSSIGKFIQCQTVVPTPNAVDSTVQNKNDSDFDWALIGLGLVLAVVVVALVGYALFKKIKWKKAKKGAKRRRNKKRTKLKEKEKEKKEEEEETNQIEQQPTQNYQTFLDLIKRWKPHPVNDKIVREPSIAIENYTPKSPLLPRVAPRRSATSKSSVSTKTSTSSMTLHPTVHSSANQSKVCLPSSVKQVTSKSTKSLFVPSTRSTLKLSKSKNKSKSKLSSKASSSPVTSSKATAKVPKKKRPKASPCNKVTSKLSAIKSKLVRTVRSALNLSHSKSKKRGSKKLKNKKRNNAKKK